MFGYGTDLVVEERLDAFDKALEVAVDKLVTEGWTLPAKLPISAVYALGDTSKLDDINGFMYYFYASDDYENMQIMIRGIQQSKIKAGLIEVVTESWSAFQSKLYRVCAISMTAVIEGILSDFSKNRKSTNMKEVCAKHIENLPCNGSIIIKHVWRSYQQFTANLYQSSDFTSNEPSEINRHWLLHGRSDFNVDEMDCMRLFNAVYSLCMIKNKEA